MKNKLFDFFAIWAVTQVSLLIITGILIGVIRLFDMLPTLFIWALVIVPVIIASIASFYFNRKE